MEDNVVNQEGRGRAMQQLLADLSSQKTSTPQMWVTQVDTCPVDSLPNEILQSIFAFRLGLCIPSRAPTFPDSRCPPIVLSQVCSRWRSIVHTSPQFWNTLMIKFSPNLVLKDVECLEAWVGRTGDLPLTHRLLHYFSAKAIPSLTGRVLLWHCTVLEIFFPVQRRKEDTSVLLDTIRTVVAHIPWIRVQTLRIQGFKMPFDLYKSILQSTNLENLRLLDTDIDNSLSSPDSFQRPILLPHLRDLTIQLVSQNPCSILRYIKTPNLTSLKLETISFKTCSWQESKSTIQTQTSSIIAFFNTSHFLLESFSWSYAFPPSEDAFLEIISHLPHLQKLNISLNDEVSMMEDQPYTFSIDEHVSARLTARNGEEYELLPRLKWIDLGQVTAEVPTMDAAISFFENRGNSDLEWARMSLTVYVDWDSGYDGAGETQAVNAALERLRALAAISDLKLDKVYVNTGTWWS